MSLFTKERVVKSYEVAVANPRLVERTTDGFASLSTGLTFLSSCSQDNQHQAKINLTPEEVQEFQETREHAREILAEAELQAQEILRQAREEWDRTSEELTARLREAITAEAEAEGYQAGLVKASQEAEIIRREAHALLNLAQRALHQEYSETNESLLHLSIKIAERITRAAIEADPKRLLNILNELVLMPQERGEWRLHLSPSDLAWVSALPEMQQLACPLIGDETLRPGDSFLECEEGIFDARLTEQLDKLEQSLREELAHAEMAEVN